MKQQVQKLYIILTRKNKKINYNNLKKIDTIILAGGLGTRLKSIMGSLPKCLALINDKPFIDNLIDNCIENGLRRFIISVGYEKEKVIEHLKTKTECEIIFSEEDKPLGTGGAIKNAKKYIKSDHVLIMNGDSFISLDFNSFYNYHLNKKALITIVGASSQKNTDYGSLIFDKNFNVTEFLEKQKNTKSNYINAGVYFFDTKVFDLFPRENRFSIEKDFLTKFPKEDFFIFRSDKRLYDIGTPERYKIFQDFIKTQGE